MSKTSMSCHQTPERSQQASPTPTFRLRPLPIPSPVSSPGITALKDLLSSQDTSIVLVDSAWYHQLELYIQGSSIHPEKMDSSKFLTKHRKLKKGVKVGVDFYFLYKSVWDLLKVPEEETISIDINSKLKRGNYLLQANEFAKALLMEQETSRMNPTEICLPSAIGRNEDQEVLASYGDDEDLKKESTSTNFSSNTYSESDGSIFSGSMRLQRGRVGLENPGLFCYMNSGLQCLLSINNLVDCMLKLKTMGCLENKEASLLFAKLIQTIFSIRSGVVKPTPVWKYIVKYFPENKQHDMPEFFRFIVNQIEVELGEGSYLQKSIFNGVICSKVLCCKCLNSSSKNEAFIDLQLEISESVDKSIELFTQDENLSNGYFCGNCKTVTQALKSLSILKPPSFLILQIKRFRQLPYPHKLTSFVKFRRKMSIKTSNGVCYYDLIAICVHIGSINSGHYIAFGKRSKGWYCFDDSLCTKVTLRTVLSQHAYMLIYNKCILIL